MRIPSFSLGAVCDEMIACVCECISCSGCNCEWSVARKTTARSVHPLGTFRSTSRVTHRAYYDTPSTHAHLPERDRYIRDSIKRVVNRRIKISIKIIPDTRFLPTSRSVSPCLHEVWFTNSIHKIWHVTRRTLSALHAIKFLITSAQRSKFILRGDRGTLFDESGQVIS